MVGEEGKVMMHPSLGGIWTAPTPSYLVRGRIESLVLPRHQVQWEEPDDARLVHQRHIRELQLGRDTLPLVAVPACNGIIPG